MEKLINIICGMVVTMVLSFGTGATAEEIGPAPLGGVKVAIAEEIQQEPVRLAGAEVLPNGRDLYYLSNGLEVLISEEEGIFALYLPFMGDHCIEYETKEMLVNGIKTYSNNFNNYIQELSEGQQ